MNFKIEKSGFCDSKIVSTDGSYLEFTPPNECYSQIIIQNIKVCNRRRGEGTKLIEYLKKIAKEQYGSASIEVMDIDPLCHDISVKELIEFYKNNNFIIKPDINNNTLTAVFLFK